MNSAYFGVRPIRDTLSTLVLEMTHVWQDKNGNPSRRVYHKE